MQDARKWGGIDNYVNHINMHTKWCSKRTSPLEVAIRKSQKQNNDSYITKRVQVYSRHAAYFIIMNTRVLHGKRLNVFINVPNSVSHSQNKRLLRRHQSLFLLMATVGGKGTYVVAASYVSLAHLLRLPRALQQRGSDRVQKTCVKRERELPSSLKDVVVHTCLNAYAVDMFHSPKCKHLTLFNVSQRAAFN